MATTTQKYQEYSEQKRLLDEKLASSAARRQETFDRSAAESEEDAAKALRGKYIANRTSARQLPQIAAAKGLSGGAVKSAFRGLSGEYSEARSTLSSERDRAVAKLLESYSQGNEKDQESYAERLAALRRKYASLLGMMQLSGK